MAEAQAITEIVCVQNSCNLWLRADFGLHSNLNGKLVESLLETETNLPEKFLNWTLLS